MKISENGLAMIRYWEDCVLEAYQDVGGIWTIGYGHTEGVTEGMVWTQNQADQALASDAVSIAADPAAAPGQE
jgi:lysozyme